MNPWKPMTNPIDLKHTGKTMEETSELISAVSRCQIQGLLGSHPVTGKVNREWLEDEIADVEACLSLLKRHFVLDVDRIHERKKDKMVKLAWWHAQT